VPDENRKQMADEVMRGVLRDLNTRFIYGFVLFMVAFAWALYLLKVLFNIDIVAMTHPEQNDPRSHFDSAPIYLGIAIAMTIIAPAWGMTKARKARELAGRGKRTQGTITALGMLGHHGMVPATISFTLDGKLFKIKRDILKKDRSVGDIADVLYDPRNPRRCEISFGISKMLDSIPQDNPPSGLIAVASIMIR
jgi:hypothetical protein